MKRILLPIVFLAFVHLASAQIDRDTPSKARDQVIADDLIVTGSNCVGFDCVNGESFGASTIILKENNLRIRFHDTSNSGSFPSNDWEIQANSSANGGGNYFSIVDIDAGRTPFTIEAGAPSNSLYVDDAGNLGLGTSTPVVEVQVVDGDSPTMRLEQNGSSGFTAQTWDVAGNETNFFVRDVTNGSKLPFKIFPNAPTNSLIVEGTTGDVGIGIQSPDATLHVRRSNGTAGIKVEEVSTTAAGRNLLAIVNNGPARFTLDNTNGSGTEWQMQSSNTGTYILQDNADPAEQEFILDGAGNLEITGDLTANGMLTMSDRRLKKDISDFNYGLEVIKELKPVSYVYNGLAGLNTDRSHIGLIAQDLQQIAPYLVYTNHYRQEDKIGNVIKSEDYLKIDEGSIRYLLVNAIKEQQRDLEQKENRIGELEKQVDELQSLKEKVEALEEVLESIGGNSVDVLLRGKEEGSLGQNIPNPYQQDARIAFVIPKSANSAEILFYDTTGKMLKQVTIAERGRGELKVKAEDLPEGTYTYTLVVDGRLIDTKKMILNK